MTAKIIIDTVIVLLCMMSMPFLIHMIIKRGKEYRAERLERERKYK